MGLKEWQVPPKWLLVEDSDNLFHLWWENHRYQETQDQNIAALSTRLDSLVREKVVLEERICALELQDEVMWGLVDSLVRMGEAQSNRLDFLQYLANNFIGTVMEWDAGGGRGNVPSESACQHAIFRTILNLLFLKLASAIPTIAMPLNAKPPTPLYFYPLYVKPHQEEQRTTSPLEKTMVQLRPVSLWDIQPSKSNKCLSIAKGFNDCY